jgi:CTP synthase
VLGKEKAQSTELDPATPNPVICILPEQKEVVDLGGTMRLGAHSVKLQKGCMVAKLYGTVNISERHRHRYEVNPDYIDELEKAGMKFVGKAKDMRRMEVLEIKNHPYFVGSQFHPEFKSRPGNPSRLHLGLVRAAIEYNKGRKRKKGKK